MLTEVVSSKKMKHELKLELCYIEHGETTIKEIKLTHK